jgi:hypothetical protein
MDEWNRRVTLLVAATLAVLALPLTPVGAEHGHGGGEAEGGGIHELECAAGWRDHVVEVHPAQGFAQPCHAVERPSATLVRVIIHDLCLPASAALLGKILVLTPRPTCDVIWPYFGEGLSWETHYAFQCNSGWGDYEAQLEHAAWLQPCFAHESRDEGHTVVVKISGCVSLTSGQAGVPTYGTFSIRAG